MHVLINRGELLSSESCYRLDGFLTWHSNPVIQGLLANLGLVHLMGLVKVNAEDSNLLRADLLFS